MSFIFVLLLILAVATVVLVSLPFFFYRPWCFLYFYNAYSSTRSLDTMYIFFAKRSGSTYNCYILRTPSFRGRDRSHYMPHYWTCGLLRYICWTGKIKDGEKAKILCERWSDATQKFIDTGIPEPAFRRN